MREFINFIRSDKIILRGTLISLGILGVELIALILFYRLLPPYVPVYNQLPWGTERLGSRLELFVPFSLTLGLLVINLFLLKVWYERLPLLSRILSVTTLLITLLSLIFSLRIIQLIL